MSVPQDVSGGRQEDGGGSCRRHGSDSLVRDLLQVTDG